MTNEDILKLASACGFSKDTLMDKSGYDFDAWISTPEELLEFALLIHENGYNKGYNEGYVSGSTGVFGEPLL